MTRRERLLRESLDLALVAFSPRATPSDAALALAKSDCLWKAAQVCRVVTDGGDNGATDRWFSDIEALAAFEVETKKARPPKPTRGT